MTISKIETVVKTKVERVIDLNKMDRHIINSTV